MSMSDDTHNALSSALSIRAATTVARVLAPAATTGGLTNSV